MLIEDEHGAVISRVFQRSAETRKPVRVIRGFKLDSPYAPSEGCAVLCENVFQPLMSSVLSYRYDGLYTVEKVSHGSNYITVCTDSRIGMD